MFIIVKDEALLLSQFIRLEYISDLSLDFGHEGMSLGEKCRGIIGIRSYGSKQILLKTREKFSQYEVWEEFKTRIIS